MHHGMPLSSLSLSHHRCRPEPTLKKGCLSSGRRLEDGSTAPEALALLLETQGTTSCPASWEHRALVRLQSTARWNLAIKGFVREAFLTVFLILTGSRCREAKYRRRMLDLFSDSSLEVMIVVSFLFFCATLHDWNK